MQWQELLHFISSQLSLPSSSFLLILPSPFVRFSLCFFVNRLLYIRKCLSLFLPFLRNQRKLIYPYTFLSGASSTSQWLRLLDLLRAPSCAPLLLPPPSVLLSAPLALLSQLRASALLVVVAMPPKPTPANPRRTSSSGLVSPWLVVPVHTST